MGDFAFTTARAYGSSEKILLASGGRKKDKSVGRNFMCTIRGMNYATADLNFESAHLHYSNSTTLSVCREMKFGAGMHVCAALQKNSESASTLPERERLICMTITRPGQLQLFAYCNTLDGQITLVETLWCARALIQLCDNIWKLHVGQ